MKFFKLFLIVILVMSVSCISYSYKQNLPREKQCTITNDRGNVWVRIIEVDRASTTTNNGWPIYSSTLYGKSELKIDNAYGKITIHYQRQNSDRGYGIFDIKCDNNIVRIPQ